MIVKDADEAISNLTSEMYNPATTEEPCQTIQNELSALQQKRADAQHNHDNLWL